MQQWYNLSDGAMEDALYEIASMGLFAKLSLDQAIPDRTTIMNFRHLLEQHQLARQLFEAINQWLCDASIMMKQGTLVDATIIEAPSSTKNKRGARDPEMHQTKKGNQWYFGMKAHIGGDAKSGLTHSLETAYSGEVEQPFPRMMLAWPVYCASMVSKSSTLIALTTPNVGSRGALFPKSTIKPQLPQATVTLGAF
jgi:IS5 family transposase